MKTAEIHVADLTALHNPRDVLAEVEYIVRMMCPSSNWSRPRMVFADIVKMFNGSYVGYQHCKTPYHDLQHTLSVFLAMARLMHGASAVGIRLSQGTTAMGLIGSLFHDVGFIKAVNENGGTGAQFTSTHVSRSIKMMGDYFAGHGFSADDYALCCSLLQCTDLSLKAQNIAFRSAEEQLLGQMLGTADIVGQMAERAYLEKLLLLYREFQEGGIGFYQSELDLLDGTMGFNAAMQSRLCTDLGNTQTYFRPHFLRRWRIDRDLYADAIEKNMGFLGAILTTHRHDYRSCLRREGILERIYEPATLCLQATY